MKILCVVGARPQFIKLGALQQAIKKNSEIKSITVHTGQHYDSNMSEIFFEQLEIDKPEYNLEINQIERVESISKMVNGIKEILFTEKPDWVVVFGDTNSTLAGAMAAKELNIRVAHIEAGLRSFNNEMPEELNRIQTDQKSDLLFAPTLTAIKNLKDENYHSNQIVHCGDIMLDAFEFYKRKALLLNNIIPNLPSKFILCSLHRQGLLENREALAEVIESLNEINEIIPIIFPAHPRTFNVFRNMAVPITFRIVDPQSYFSILNLLDKCCMVITDSGGLQKEAFFAKRGCITIREDTEWVELVEAGVNLLAGLSKEGIIHAFELACKTQFDFSKQFYGNGDAAEIIINKLVERTN